MGIYLVTMKTGQQIKIEAEKNLIGLWIWSKRQYSPQVLSFGNIALDSSEISTIEKITFEEIEQDVMKKVKQDIVVEEYEEDRIK